MASLCDVSFLLPVCHKWHEHHVVAKAHLEALSNEAEFVICRIGQLGFLRLLTTLAAMQESVCTTDEAWEVYETMMSDDRFVFRNEPPALEGTLRELTRGFQFSSKLWQDAYLAAFAFESGLQLVTFDHGFKKFKGLDCLLLTPNK